MTAAHFLWHGPPACQVSGKLSEELCGVRRSVWSCFTSSRLQSNPEDRALVSLFSGSLSERMLPRNTSFDFISSMNACAVCNDIVFLSVSCYVKLDCWRIASGCWGCQSEKWVNFPIRGHRNKAKPVFPISCRFHNFRA